jgi:hypothetical protein
MNSRLFQCGRHRKVFRPVQNVVCNNFICIAGLQTLDVARNWDASLFQFRLSMIGEYLHADHNSAQSCAIVLEGSLDLDSGPTEFEPNGRLESCELVWLSSLFVWSD